MNILDFASPAVVRAYTLLEGEQDLLTVAKEAQECFAALVAEKEEYREFLPALEENLILKVLKTAS